MIGAIAGDIIGSPYEFAGMKRVDFPLFIEKCRFTDDSVMTIAVAEVILHKRSYVDSFKRWGLAYPYAGYGGMFHEWLFSDNIEPYNSFGNGSAMRVSPIGFAFDSLEEVLEEAKRSAEVTHNHLEGIKGAQSVASAIFLARIGKSKEAIKKYITTQFGYNLSRTLDEIRPSYSFRVTCQDSVPEAIIAFLESNDWEDAVRKGVSLGGDADTIGCIVGGIAQAYYKGIPEHIEKQVFKILPYESLVIINEFDKKYSN